MNVTVLGCGRWGTFLAWYSDKLGHRTTLWGRPSSKNLNTLRRTRRNSYIELKDSLKLEDDLLLALDSADFVIISISAQQFRNLLKDIKSSGYDIKKPLFVLCMKGIEATSGKRLSTVFKEELESDNVAIWVGPGHVQSFSKNIPNCMVVDSEIEQHKNAVIKAFGSDLIRFYYGSDLIGNEIGAAAKNVIGIAAGMLDGLGLTALKGALMARAPREISRLNVALGGDSNSAYGLAHLGDYEATLFSAHSNNRRFGEDWVLGKEFDKLAEGVSTVEAMMKLADKYDIDLPICRCVYRILFGAKDPRDELDSLFERSIKREFI